MNGDFILYRWDFYFRKYEVLLLDWCSDLLFYITFYIQIVFFLLFLLFLLFFLIYVFCHFLILFLLFLFFFVFLFHSTFRIKCIPLINREWQRVFPLVCRCSNHNCIPIHCHFHVRLWEFDFAFCAFLSFLVSKDEDNLTLIFICTNEFWLLLLLQILLNIIKC